MKLATEPFTEYQSQFISWIRDPSADFCPKPGGTFNRFALELFQLQYRFVPPYQTYCRSRGMTPETVTGWTEIPYLPSAAFKEFSLTSLPENEITHSFISSGTTERNRSRHHHSPSSLATYETAILKGFDRYFPQWASRDSGVPLPHFISLTPPPDQAPHSSLVHMFDLLMRSRSAASPRYLGRASNPTSPWLLNFDSIQSTFLNLPSPSAPLFLLTTAFSWVHFLDWVRSSQLSFKFPSNTLILETGGYKGQSRSLTPGALRQETQDVLGISPSQILCEYGMSELSSQAYDLNPLPPNHPVPPGNHTGRPFRFPPWVGIRILDPETLKPCAPGSIGLLQILDLANVRSLASLLTEDLAIAQEDDSFFLLGRSDQSDLKGCSLFAHP